MEQNFNVTTYIQHKTNEYYVTAAVFPGLCESRLNAASFVLNGIKIQSFQGMIFPPPSGMLDPCQSSSNNWKLISFNTTWLHHK